MEHVAKRDAQQKMKWGEIDGASQTLGFGENSDKKYGGVLKKNPKYAEYLLGEGRRGRLDVEKFTEWIHRRTISKVIKKEKDEASE